MGHIILWMLGILAISSPFAILILLIRREKAFEQELLESFELQERMSNAEFQSSVQSSLRKMKSAV